MQTTARDDGRHDSGPGQRVEAVAFNQHHDGNDESDQPVHQADDAVELDVLQSSEDRSKRPQRLGDRAGGGDDQQRPGDVRALAGLDVQQIRKGEPNGGGDRGVAESRQHGRADRRAQQSAEPARSPRPSASATSHGNVIEHAEIREAGVGRAAHPVASQKP